MRSGGRGLRVLIGAVAVATTLAGLAASATATSTFALNRLSGNDRYLTAGTIDQSTFPSGESTALLADGVTGHQSDALAASGVEGVYSIGVLLTDNTTTVPQSTLTALSNNKVTKIVVVGGPTAVSPQQVSQLQAKGYTVTTPYQGNTRYQTMQMVDTSMGGAGSDGSGNPTAILASGDDHHLVDALSAGGLAYAKHFPIILTNSQGPALQPEAQQVITNMGIKHLIVVGGTASIPASEYNPPPAGVTKVDVEAGADRSLTSSTLADFAISNKWLADTNMTLARGDDGADALAGAAFAGSHAWPTVVTNSPTDAGATTSFATEHASTLAGNSYIFGGTSAVPDSQKSAVQTAGGGSGGTSAGSGTFGTAAGTTPVVTAETTTSFTEGSSIYNYKASDTYQIVTTSSNPGSNPACTPDSYADFQAKLSNGDSVSGTYSTSGASTFCLNDQAPHTPPSASAASSSSGSGVTVTWSQPTQAGTDNISSYTIWRAPASVQNPSQPSQTVQCPSAYTVSPGTSPQTPPASGSGYTALTTVPAGASSTMTYNDTSATAGNFYCYAVSSVAPNATGGNQTSTAQPAPASQNPLTPAQPTAVQGAGTGGSTTTAPISVQSAFANSAPNGGCPAPMPTAPCLTPGATITVTFNEAMADPSGGNWSLNLAAPCTATAGGTCTNSENPIMLNPVNTQASVSGKTITFTLTGSPLTGSPVPAPSGTVMATNLEFRSASGINSVASAGGKPWNLPLSGLPTISATRVVSASSASNANLPSGPSITAVTASGSSASNPNTVTYKCVDTGSTTLNVYSTEGVLLGTATCGTGGSSQTQTPTAVGNPSPNNFKFVAGTAYLFTESDGTSNNQESQTVGFQAQ